MSVMPGPEQELLQGGDVAVSIADPNAPILYQSRVLWIDRDRVGLERPQHDGVAAGASLGTSIYLLRAFGARAVQYRGLLTEVTKSPDPGSPDVWTVVMPQGLHNGQVVERRAEERVPVNIPVKYVMDAPPRSTASLQEYMGTLRDLSRNGGALVTKVEIAVGSSIILRFKPAALAKSLVVRSTVMSCRRLPPPTDGFLHGLRFGVLRREVEDALDQALHINAGHLRNRPA